MGDTKPDHSGKERFVDAQRKWFQVTSASLINFLPLDLRVILKLTFTVSEIFFEVQLLAYNS